MKKYYVLLFPLFLLLVPSKCSANWIMNYSEYDSTDLTSSDGVTFTLSQTVGVDGYTVYQPPPYMRIGAVHTPHVFNQIGASGGWFVGPNSCPTCYINFSATTSTQISPGQIVDGSLETQVICSAAGVIYEVTGSSSFQVARSNVAFQGTEADPADPTQQFCLYYLSCPNGNAAATCPDNKVIYGPNPITEGCPAKFHCYHKVTNGKCSDYVLCFPATDDENCT